MGERGFRSNCCCIFREGCRVQMRPNCRIGFICSSLIYGATLLSVFWQQRATMARHSSYTPLTTLYNISRSCRIINMSQRLRKIDYTLKTSMLICSCETNQMPCFIKFLTCNLSTLNGMFTSDCSIRSHTKFFFLQFIIVNICWKV